MDLSKLSNSDLLAMRAQAQANPLANLTDEQLLTMRAQADGPKQASAGGGGIAKQLASGATEAIASMPGLLGDARDWIDRGIDLAAGAAGIAPTGPRPRPLAPSTSEILTAAQPVTGELPAPQTTAEKYARTIGQFGVGALIPGGVGRRAVGGVLAPAVASETAAQQAPEGYETAFRLAGGLGGGILGAARMPTLGANARANRVLSEMMTPQTPGQLAALGPDAFMLEGNPTLMQTAQGVVQRPGQASEQLRTAVTERHAGAAQRLQDDVRGALGAPISPNRVDARIGRAQAQLGPDYRAATAIANPVNSGAILNVIDQDAARLAGRPRQALDEIRGFFFDGNRLKNTAGELLSIRQAIDDMIPRYEGQTNATRVISETRQAVDDAIRQASPDIKMVDARFENLARQREALERGGQVLRTGPEAVRPSELARELAPMTRNQRASLRIGARAEVDRVLGTSVYDVNALRSHVKSSGKWNHEKLAQIFGHAEADRVMRSLDREVAFRKAYDRMVSNSQTAPRLIAEEATRVSGPGNLSPEMIAGATGAVLTGNPAGAIAAAATVGGARKGWEALAAGGQKRLDRALVERLGAQGSRRDALVQALMTEQANQRGQAPRSLDALIRALIAAQGGTVPERAEAY